ncbi:IclR family transcriptional regulator [Rhodospirillaceae bacterium SYSU D60014]|uniref:IclR family transcriptional regulator n=1 Tax=Virgifigura deserti TaxID=2268457 RepID=UPI000E65FC37
MARPKSAAANARPGRPPGTPSSARSLERGLAVLELLRTQGPLRITEISRSLRIPRSSIYEIARLLQDKRYVDRTLDGQRYTLGVALHLLGMSYRDSIDLAKIGSAAVETLRDETGETVQLCILDGEQLLVLQKADGRRPIRIMSHVGTRVPVNWAASGRLLVSDLDDEALRMFLEQTARPSPKTSVTVDIPQLMRQIRVFRKRGWSLEINETNAHAGCVAAPVEDAEGHCIATLSIVAPEHRLQSSELKGLVESVCRAARRLSARLGAAQ